MKFHTMMFLSYFIKLVTIRVSYSLNFKLTHLFEKSGGESLPEKKAYLELCPLSSSNLYYSTITKLGQNVYGHNILAKLDTKPDRSYGPLIDD